MNTYSVFLQLSENNHKDIVKVAGSLTKVNAYYLCAELNKKQPDSYFFKADY